jgi:sugar/nucleoside kinase (ribokinase family)
MSVICVGILVADVIAKPVEKLPERGKLDLVDKIELHTGGCAVNTGIALSKIGIKTGIIGKVGNDGFGGFLIDTLKKNKIDVSGIVKDKNINTSATAVMVHPDGERSFIHYLGANSEFSEKDIDLNIVKKYKIIHVAGTFLMPKFDGEPTARIFKKAKKMGLITSLDTCWDSKNRWMKLLEPVLQYVDIFLPSIEEAKRLTEKETPEEIAKILMDYGVKTVGLKMGEKGCYIRTKDVQLSIPAFKINPVDATGAGDSFVAGFLTGIIKGWDLEKTGRFANAVGAMCALAIGASQGVKSLKETFKFIQNHTSNN